MTLYILPREAKAVLFCP